MPVIETQQPRRPASPAGLRVFIDAAASVCARRMTRVRAWWIDDCDMRLPARKLQWHPRRVPTASLRPPRSIQTPHQRPQQGCPEYPAGVERSAFNVSRQIHRIQRMSIQRTWPTSPSMKSIARTSISAAASSDISSRQQNPPVCLHDASISKPGPAPTMTADDAHHHHPSLTPRMPAATTAPEYADRRS